MSVYVYLWTQRNDHGLVWNNCCRKSTRTRFHTSVRIDLFLNATPSWHVRWIMKPQTSADSARQSALLTVRVQCAPLCGRHNAGGTHWSVRSRCESAVQGRLQIATFKQNLIYSKGKFLWMVESEIYCCISIDFCCLYYQLRELFLLILVKCIMNYF